MARDKVVIDPDASLLRIRALVTSLKAKLDPPGFLSDASREAVIDYADGLWASVRELDEWLENGGALPTSWQRDAS
jgi:hypothetical protein